MAEVEKQNALTSGGVAVVTIEDQREAKKRPKTFVTYEGQGSSEKNYLRAVTRILYVPNLVLPYNSRAVYIYNISA